MIRSPFAACLHAPEVDMFPTTTKQAAICRRLCRSCVVSAACLRAQFQLPATEQFGYAGEMTETKRRQHLRGHVVKLPRSYVEDEAMRLAERLEREEVAA